MKVARKIGFLKEYKVTGLSRLSPYFLKVAGEVLTLELTKLLGSTWVRE